QIQNKIEESVYTLLKIQIDRFGLRHRFRILNNKIINRVTGSEFVFYGLWRNIEEIKSLEGIDVLWLEEAHALTEYQWKILEPTIRKEGSECWFIFNPGLVTDFVWRNFV
ncbi:phage terminase large subunit, partial [Shigella flexneri]